LAFQFDDMTVHYTCNWDAVEDRLLVNSYESYVALMRDFVFGEMITLASPENQGNKAGPYGDIDLGSFAAPLRITPDTVVDFLSNLAQILQNNFKYVENQIFLVVPYSFKALVHKSPYANSCYVGAGTSIIVDGKYPSKLEGFDVYETKYLPSVHSAVVDKRCHYIIAGHKEAYAYASDIILARIVRGENTPSTKYQMICAWGGAMVYDNYVVVAFAYFDNQGVS
jgi:hypothetical protein